MDLDWSAPGLLRAPFEVTGTAPEEPEDPTTPTIVGTPGDDLLDGTDGDDIVDMGEGRDVWFATAGNDRVDGGDPGYNQIDYDGAPEDYTFTANEDGTVTVIKPNGTDIISNIGGFWFNGAGVWKPLEDLVVPNPDAGPNQIDGTPENDFLSGTLGDDLIDMGAGRDVVNGSTGNDRIEGGDTGYNQIDYDGSPEDYTFTLNDDGTVTVVKPNGTDIISNVGGFWFKGPGVWKSLEDVLDDSTPGGGDGGGGGGGGDGTINGTPEDDFLDGTDGDDIILAGGGVDTIFASAGNDTVDGQGGGYNQVNYDGKRADFVFTAQSDGSISAVSAEFGTDLLLNIDGIWFEEDAEWYAVEDLV